MGITVEMLHVLLDAVRTSTDSIRNLERRMGALEATVQSLTEVSIG